jgi:ribonuclease HI
MLTDNTIEIFTDGAMDRDTKQTGGTGFVIRFPDFIGIPDIQESFRRDGQGIHRLEMVAILEALVSLNKWLKNNSEHVKGVTRIVVNTDRYSLTELLNPWKISGWRRHGWKNHEGKPIKDKDLLDKIDKNRKKLSDNIYGRVEIVYLRRKYNKEADKLSKLGKRSVKKGRIVLSEKGSKISKRLFDGGEVKYSNLVVGEPLDVRVYLKDPVQKEFEVLGEIIEGEHFGMKIRIYISFMEELELHRNHYYRFTIKEVRKHHIRVMSPFEEIDPE